MAPSGGPPGAATAQPALWIPTLVLANLFAAAFLIQTWLLANPGTKHALRQWLRAARGLAAPLPVTLGARAAPASGPGAPPAASGGAAAPAGRKAHAAEGGRGGARVLVVAGPEDSDRDGGGGGSDNGSSVPPSAAGAAALAWEGVGVSCKSAAGTKWVLRDAWGRAAAGEMQALLGPSGAGKSTLLEVLALSRRPTAGRVSLAPPGGRRAIAFVPQDDAFAATLSVSEVLCFYEALTPPPPADGALPGAAWAVASHARVGAVARVMGLEGACDTLVGGALPGGLSLRGLSGGERKRLAIACGILGRPHVLLLDEPTSGLDSCAARSVVAHVRGMAREGGCAVVASIHQPAAALWAMFDSATLLAGGRLLYNGPAPGLAPRLGASLGRAYEPAVHGLPSDFALELASAFGGPGDYGGLTGGGGGVTSGAAEADLALAADEFARRQREEWGDQYAHARPRRGRGGAGGAGSSQDDGGSSSSRSSSGGGGGSGGGSTAAAARAPPKRRGAGSQFGTLLRRELLLVTRNPADVAGRTLTFVWVATLVGVCFYSVPDSAQGVRARLNILFSYLCFLLLMPFLSTSLMAGGKEAFVRDAAARLYSPGPYYAAKVAASLPFGVLSAAAFHLVQYGMTGLRHGAGATARSCALGVVAYLVGAQALHLAVLVAPHQDSAFMLAIGWTSLQMIFSGFFVGFRELRFGWLAQLRHISAMYFALEGSAAVEFGGREFPCQGGGGPTQGTEEFLSALLAPGPGGGGGGAPPAAAAAAALLAGGGGGGCVVRGDALLSYLDFGSRGFGGSLGALLAYLGILHVLCRAAAWALTRRR